MSKHHHHSKQAQVDHLQTLIRELLDSYIHYADNGPATRQFIADCRRASCPLTSLPQNEGDEGDTLPPGSQGHSQTPDSDNSPENPPRPDLRQTPVRTGMHVTR